MTLEKQVEIRAQQLADARVDAVVDDNIELRAEIKRLRENVDKHRQLSLDMARDWKESEEEVERLREALGNIKAYCCRKKCSRNCCSFDAYAAASRTLDPKP